MMLAVKGKPETVESLHQVGGGDITHWLDANTFLLHGNPLVLFECAKPGYPLLRQRLMGRFGLLAADIDVVLATHGHWDHVSGMELMSQESEAAFFVPNEDAEGVKRGDTASTAAYYYGEEARPLKVDGMVDDDFCLETDTAKITAIKTPWHTPGSVCYRVEQDRSVTLIAGDTLYGFYFPLPGRSILSDIEQGRDSLRRLRQGEYDYMAMGHAVLGFMDDVEVRLEEAERQFAIPEVIQQIEVLDGDLPECVNLWQKPRGQQFKY